MVDKLDQVEELTAEPAVDETVDEPQTKGAVYKIAEPTVISDDAKGLKKLKNKIGDFLGQLFRKLAIKFDNSGFKKVLKKIIHVIGIGLYYIFYPIVLFKKKVYDKWTNRGQKVFVSIMFLMPAIIGFLVFYLYPLINSLIYAFSTVQVPPEGGLQVDFGKHIDKNTGVWVKDLFYNFKELISGPTGMLPIKNATTGTEAKISLFQALLQTSWQTILNTLVITIFSLLIAVMLNGNFKGRTVARAIFFLPVILNSKAIEAATSSTQAIDSMLHSVGQNALTSIFDMKTFMTSIGIPGKLVTFLNGITSTIYSTISYAGIQILIFLAAIQSVPGHLYEAATIEGATKYEQFWKITLPMVSPMILTVVVYTIVDSFLRSDLSEYIQQLAKNPLYGFHAAASWCYIITSLLILGIAVLVLRKVVFYYDEK